jgi:hypothetical protein
VTTTIKHSTAGVPSSLFLAVGLGGDGTVSNRSFQRRGKWATLSFDMLITGLHNRLIKVGTIRKIAGPCVGAAAGISNRPLVDKQAEQRNLAGSGYGDRRPTAV